MLSAIVFAAALAAVGEPPRAEVCQILSTALQGAGAASEFYRRNQISAIDYESQAFSRRSIPTTRWQDYERRLDRDFPLSERSAGPFAPNCNLSNRLSRGEGVRVIAHRPLINVRARTAFVLFEANMGAREHLPGVVSTTPFTPVFCRLSKAGGRWRVTSCQKSL